MYYYILFICLTIPCQEHNYRYAHTINFCTRGEAERAIIELQRINKGMLIRGELRYDENPSSTDKVRCEYGPA